jgi:beta-1,4-mannosyl-glycoprotein beta-1,4-N-acetylglucosaminyltransferase
MRQKVKLKNLKYSLYRIDKEKNIEIFDDAGWHFNNIMTPEEISLKLKTFAHTEYSSERYSSVDVIKKKINNKVDLFERGHEYQVLKLNEDFPEYILENLEKYGEFIIK